MTKKATATADVVEEAAPSLTRNELRDALLGSVPKPESKVIEMFGVDIELRQPSLGAIMKARETGDQATRAVEMIIEYAFVPGTDDHVFDAADSDVIKNWPFGKDLARLNDAVAELTGVDIEAAIEDLKNDPLEG